MITQKYTKAGNLCAVHIPSLQLPIPETEAVAILERLSFEVIHTNLVQQARNQVGKARYRRGARMDEAPEIFDCSSLMKWIYAEVGIGIPRRSIQQRDYEGAIVANPTTLVAGDLIFTKGKISYYYDNPEEGVGHVGMVTENNTVIHAANEKCGIVEDALHFFMTRYHYVGARSYWLPGSMTLRIPENREIERSDDLRWIILQNLE